MRRETTQKPGNMDKATPVCSGFNMPYSGEALNLRVSSGMILLCLLPNKWNIFFMT